MNKPTAEQRATRAKGYIRRLTVEINYHDEMASSLRKDREKEKAKLKRALLALEREAQSNRYEASR